ncbi:hypothetical protein DV736_g3204, partial [Chaetothyriales sp. CBS 134916]
MSSSVAARFVPAVARCAFRSPSVVRRSFHHPQLYQYNKTGARRSLATSTSLLSKKYTEEHEWIELGADGKTGTIGITEYAAQQLGDVVYVELPEIGAEVTKGDTIGAVESVKSASDIMTPVTGTVVDHNQSLEDKPGNINKAPETDAWLAKIEITDPADLDALMDKDSYIKKAFVLGNECILTCSTIIRLNLFRPNLFDS